MRTPRRTRPPYWRWIAGACALALAGVPAAARGDAPCEEIGTVARAIAGDDSRIGGTGRSGDDSGIGGTANRFESVGRVTRFDWFRSKVELWKL